MKLWKIGMLLRIYGKAARAWYGNQANGQLMQRANRLQRQAKAAIRDYDGSAEMLARLYEMYLAEHWSIGRILPTR